MATPLRQEKAKTVVTHLTDDADCYICKESGGDVHKWIGCSLCNTWAHIKCAGLSGIKFENVRQINWICTPCHNQAKLSKELMKKVDFLTQKMLERDTEFARKLSEMDAELVKLRQELACLQAGLEH